MKILRWVLIVYNQNQSKLFVIANINSNKNSNSQREPRDTDAQLPVLPGSGGVDQWSVLSAPGPFHSLGFGFRFLERLKVWFGCSLKGSAAFWSKQLDYDVHWRENQNWIWGMIDRHSNSVVWFWIRTELTELLFDLSGLDRLEPGQGSDSVSKSLITKENTKTEPVCGSVFGLLFSSQTVEKQLRQESTGSDLVLFHSNCWVPVWSDAGLGL